MLFLLSGLFLASFVPELNAQLTVLGACPSVPPMQYIDFPRYLGVWYEVEKYLFLPEIIGSCVYVHYKDFNPYNASFKADIAQIESYTRKLLQAKCDGKLGPHGSAAIDLTVHLPVPLSTMPVDVPYPFYVLDTDYQTYSIKWRCKEVLTVAGVANLQTMWILSRTREYPEEMRQYIHEKLKHLGINPQYLVRSDQSNCPK